MEEECVFFPELYRLWDQQNEVVLLTLVAGKGQVLYGIALLFCYAIGHCLLMLFAGTFTGFVEAFAKTRGVVNLSNWSRKLSGCIISVAGAWFIWQAF